MADDNENCPPLREILPDEKERQQVEKEIENLIEADFLSSTAAIGALSVFRDPGNDSDGHNLSRKAFAQWLKTFAGVPVDEARLEQDFQVPDIASRRDLPVANTNEFYEIKPDNANGLRDATAKIADVQKLMTDLRLLFVPGIDYDPPGGREIKTTIMVGGVEFEVRLAWRLRPPGRILYKICIKAKQPQEVPVYLKVLTGVGLFVLAIIFFLMGLRGGGMRVGPGVPVPMGV
jgi:hypothetical protein